MSPERQALVDVVPLLTKIEDGDCESSPYESCSRSCQRTAERALEIVLDALSPYPGKDRWSEPSLSPDPASPPPEPAADPHRCVHLGGDGDSCAACNNIGTHAPAADRKDKWAPRIVGVDLGTPGGDYSVEVEIKLGPDGRATLKDFGRVVDAVPAEEAKGEATEEVLCQRDDDVWGLLCGCPRCAAGRSPSDGTGGAP